MSLSHSFPFHRLIAGSGMILAGVLMFLSQTGVALAHHVDLTATTDCHSYHIHADYIGGDETRFAEVRVNGTLVETVTFPSGTEEALSFFALEGGLPTNTTVNVRMFRPTGGAPVLEDDDSVTVNKAMTCTVTPTITATATGTATASATSTATPVDTQTPVASETPAPTETPTSEPTRSSTPTSEATPTGTPSTSTPTVSTHTPVPTNTPEEQTPVEESPTFVSTVESLRPPNPPSEPGTSGYPPSETASGLPSTGDGTAGMEGVAIAIAAVVLAAAGLAVMSTGVRWQTRT